jgi:hypothetical protein
VALAGAAATKCRNPELGTTAQPPFKVRALARKTTFGVPRAGDNRASVSTSEIDHKEDEQDRKGGSNEAALGIGAAGATVRVPNTEAPDYQLAPEPREATHVRERLTTMPFAIRCNKKPRGRRG